MSYGLKEVWNENARESYQRHTLDISTYRNLSHPLGYDNLSVEGKTFFSSNVMNRNTPGHGIGKNTTKFNGV